jgi:protein SCO1/2
MKEVVSQGRKMFDEESRGANFARGLVKDKWGRLMPYEVWRRFVRVASGALLVFIFSLQASAQPRVPGPSYGPMRNEANAQPQGLPPDLREVRIEQRLNNQVPLDLQFRDEAGRTVQLKEYFGAKPVVLALVYYECPMLCNQVLNGLLGSLKMQSLEIGKDYNVVTVSFDPRETAELAAKKKATYLQRLQRPGAEQGWHFLTGDQDSIKQLADAVGFHYKYDEATKQFAHASAIMVLTPQGRLSHYFYGIEYAPKDLRLALVESSAGKIGSPVDQLLLYCYHYDPTTGKYGAVIMNIMRLGGVVTLLGIGALLLFLKRPQWARASVAEKEQKAGGTI